MILIHSSIKTVRVNSWGDAWSNLQKRRKTYGGFSITYNGLLYGGDYFAMRQFCRTADLLGVQVAIAEHHHRTVGLKLVVNG